MASSPDFLDRTASMRRDRPRSRICRALWKPRPLLAPVMIATWPERLIPSAWCLIFGKSPAPSKVGFLGNISKDEEVMLIIRLMNQNWNGSNN